MIEFNSEVTPQEERFVYLLLIGTSFIAGLVILPIIAFLFNWKIIF